MPDRDHIEQLIAKHRRYLQLLEEQKATYGLDCPPHVSIGIEDTRAEIAKLEAQLGIGEQPKVHSNTTFGGCTGDVAGIFGGRR